MTILNKEWSVTRVAVSLFNQHDEIAASEESLIPQAPTPIIFQVPQNAANASYRIYIRGTLLNGDVVFYNETSVIFHPKSLSIFIQLDRPMYRHDQTGDGEKDLLEFKVMKYSRCWFSFSSFSMHSGLFRSTWIF